MDVGVLKYEVGGERRFLQGLVIVGRGTMTLKQGKSVLVTAPAPEISNDINRDT